MKTRKGLFFLFFLSISWLVQSQNPGYLGKKATLLVNVPSFPTISGPSWNNRGGSNFFGEDGGGLAISPVLEFELGYTIGRDQQLKLGYGLWRTGAIVVVNTPTLDPTSTGGFGGEDEHELFYQLSLRTVTLGRKEFNLLKGSIAPLGTYLGLNLQYTKVTGSIADKRTFYYGQEFYGHEPLIIDDEANYFAFGFEAGRQNIFWDRLVTNVGFRVNIPLNIRRLGYAIEDGGSYLSSVDEDEVVQESYYQAVFERLALHSLVQFHVGVGLLLF